MTATTTPVTAATAEKASVHQSTPASKPIRLAGSSERVAESREEIREANGKWLAEERKRRDQQQDDD